MTEKNVYDIKIRKRRRPRHKEDDEQAALYAWARLFRWNGRPLDRCMFAIPNGGKRDAREAGRLKKQGVRAGVSDNFLHIPRPPYAGMFLELKTGDNKPTDKQSEFMDDASGDGYATAVAWGFIEAKRMIIDYLEGRHAEQAVRRDQDSRRAASRARNM